MFPFMAAMMPQWNKNSLSPFLLINNIKLLIGTFNELNNQF